MSNLNISNIVNVNKSNDSIILNKNTKSSIKNTKKINDNFNENNESIINKTFCNTNPQINKAFDFSQAKIDSENSLNFKNNSEKESIQQSLSNNSNNNMNILRVKNEDETQREEENEQKNAKIMLKSNLNILSLNFIKF